MRTIAHDDAWARDSGIFCLCCYWVGVLPRSEKKTLARIFFEKTGPTFVVSPSTGEVRAVGWNFNGYGGKLPHEHNVHVAKQMATESDTAWYKCPLILEGGAIHVDGGGFFSF